MKVLMAAAVVLVLLVIPVHAYVDPGTGSLLLQIIMGGLTGAFFFFWTPICRGIKYVKGRIFGSHRSK